MIDSHLHLWDLQSGDQPAKGLPDAGRSSEQDALEQDGAARPYSWLGPQHGALFRSFGEAEAQQTIADAGVSAAVLVQADDTLADTESMLAVADRNDWVLAVVGWIPLEHPEQAAAALERFARNPKFRGVRHLIHDDPRDNFLELPEVRESLRLVAARGLALDIPDAFPRHLGRAADLACDLPELTVVLDHLGKPPLGATAGPDAGAADDGLDRWRREFRALAGLPNTVAKVSGLYIPGTEYSAPALRPVWEEALASFGPQRLMIGMDWPVSTLGAPYQRTLDVLLELTEELDAAGRHAFLEATAQRIYGPQHTEDMPEAATTSKEEGVRA
ncbi:amidohydrolase family protein [Arthrobacter sp. CDRTa11]|uniref:amidohydrolase family protein n=1 Tax=Arthrobacter sp. CDRTa11 TaxID=2651199 RepID=UPI002265CFA2|nr:amidohydrolase family protein [Arthrobacter sp. CDRTa11]UZX05040.1 amidohydrolase family protein [Arthrobacter sp. CDRTa11]